MDDMAFLSVRVPESIRNRVKAVAAQRGERVQDLVGGLIERFLEEAERRPPELGDVLRGLRALEAPLRTKGVAALYVFGSVARGNARPDSDVDLAIDFMPDEKPSLFDIVHIKEEIEVVLGHAVDLGERSALTRHVAATAERDLVRVF
jgi:predicted nucleotidyltransferase